MVVEHSTEIMIWLLGAPYRLLLWLCRIGCYQPTWLWELNYIKLLHQSLGKHPVGFPPVSFIPNPGKTYQGMFTGASSTKSSLYHSWGIYLEMIQGGFACSNICLSTEASVSILWYFQVCYLDAEWMLLETTKSLCSIHAHHPALEHP